MNYNDYYRFPCTTTQSYYFRISRSRDIDKHYTNPNKYFGNLLSVMAPDVILLYMCPDPGLQGLTCTESRCGVDNFIQVNFVNTELLGKCYVSTGNHWR